MLTVKSGRLATGVLVAGCVGAGVGVSGARVFVAAGEVDVGATAVGVGVFWAASVPVVAAASATRPSSMAKGSNNDAIRIFIYLSLTVRNLPIYHL
jgi:hypothetical protein